MFHLDLRFQEGRSLLTPGLLEEEIEPAQEVLDQLLTEVRMASEDELWIDMI